MLKILLNHFIINAGINAFFDNLIKSFHKDTYTKWLTSESAFHNDNKIGSIIYIDMELWLIDSFVGANNSVLRIKNYPAKITAHLPVGVDNKLRMYVKSDLYLNEFTSVVVFDPVVDKWILSAGTFSYYLNKELLLDLGIILQSKRS